MRKSLVLLLLAASVMPAFAQVDTLQWRQREPTFYYWGTHWADCQEGGVAYKDVQLEALIEARRCIADSTLRVIGVAAPVSKYIHGYRADSTDAFRAAEYFQLYEATADSFYLVAEVRYDTAHPRYRMEMHEPWHGWFNPSEYDDYEDVPYVYEAYFDRPYTVRDSFYVAVTHNNSDWQFNNDTRQYEESVHYPTLYYYISSREAEKDYYRIRYTNPFDQVAESGLTERQSELRNLYLQGWIPVDPNVTTWGAFLHLFPIFDTTGLDIHGFQWVGECDTISNMQLVDITDGVVYLSWNAGEHGLWWEVAYGLDGTTPESGLRDTVQSSFIRLEGLQQDSDYVVYVRERCREDTRSPWSQPFAFRMPHVSDESIPQKTVVDIHTHLIPNPASGPVTVISGFRIEAIEVYTTAGALVSTQQVKANSTMLDVRTLPAGTYILRIRTSHGDTAKKLTVINN